MTSPLVNPVAGYSTLSRLDRPRRRPSTSIWVKPCSSGLAGGDLLGRSLRRLLGRRARRGLLRRGALRSRALRRAGLWLGVRLVLGTPGARVALAGGLRRSDARLERRHEVDDLGGRRLLRCGEDLGRAARLAVDELEHLIAVGVAELR